MIIVTGGAGFIGSAIVWELNRRDEDDILVVDRLGCEDKWRNLRKARFRDTVSPDELWSWLEENRAQVRSVVHMGACSSTLETDADFLRRNNTQYSQRLFRWCAESAVPFIYASSAATYGGGEHGYDDTTRELAPINKYGWSKFLFDRWAYRQEKAPPTWVGLKFFNVYGPNEYHKGGMQSLVPTAVRQILDTGVLRLFKSYRDDVAHGDQRRDFIYVKDVSHLVGIIEKNSAKLPSGVYNVGTGTARSFADLGRAVFSALGREPCFEWIEMPEALRPQYQYFTEAEMVRTRKNLVPEFEPTPLEEGVRDYACQYLLSDDPYL